MLALLIALLSPASATEDPADAQAAATEQAAPTRDADGLPIPTTKDQEVLRELMDFAPNVVHAMVVKADTHSTSAGLMTAYTFAVFETFHGKTAEMFTFWLPGGQRGGVRQRSYGVPIFDEGDDVVLFVRPEGDALYRGMFEMKDGQLLDCGGRPVASEAALDMFERDQIEALANR